MMFTAAVIPPLVLGLALIWLGLRGRRVDDHPFCRRCGFDLFGRPEASDRCAECGADLLRPRATRDGRRARRPGVIAAGFLFLGIALTLAAGAGYAAYLARDAQANKPSWWLVRELGSGDHATVVAAAQELLTRVSTGALAQQYVDRTADQLLQRQADAAATWNPVFGDFLENARFASKLDDARFHRYAAQAPGYTLEVRPRINRGDPLPFTIHARGHRVGSRSTLRARYKTSNSIDAVAVGNAIGSKDTLSPRGGGGLGSVMQFAKYADQLAPGRREAKVLMHLELQLASAPEDAQPLAWTKKMLTAPFELRLAEVPVIEVVRDERLRSAIEHAVKIERVRGGTGNADRLDFSVTIDPVPVDVAFEVFVRRAGGHTAATATAERRVTSIAIPATPNSSHSHGISMRLPGFAGDHIDVILRPSVDAAKQTHDVFGVWDGEIVKRDVRVMRTQRAAAPAGK